MDLIFQLSSCVKKKFAGQPGQSDFINSSPFMGKNVYVFEKVEKPQARGDVWKWSTALPPPCLLGRDVGAAKFICGSNDNIA